MRKILRLEDGHVEVATDAGEIAARYLIDATGQATMLGKHLKTRRVLPHLKKIAYFGHFDNVWRRPGDEGGYIVVVVCEEGWFWMIPLDETRMSIGLVMHDHVARQVGLPPDQMLAWGISRCPELQRRTASATFPTETHVVADFSYRCTPYAGPGYFLVGDAATFIDPIFSTGVCMGMMSGVEAGRAIAAIVQQRRRRRRLTASATPAAARTARRRSSVWAPAPTTTPSAKSSSSTAEGAAPGPPRGDVDARRQRLPPPRLRPALALPAPRDLRLDQPLPPPRPPPRALLAPRGAGGGGRCPGSDRSVRRHLSGAGSIELYGQVAKAVTSVTAGAGGPG